MPLRKLVVSWSLPGPKSDGITLAKVSLADTAMDKRSVERVKDGSEAAVVPGKLPEWCDISILICQHCSVQTIQSKCWRITSHSLAGRVPLSREDRRQDLPGLLV